MTGGSSILVVEDDPSLRMLCRVSLELEQFDVRDAATLEEARAEIEAERPGLVFLDLQIGRNPSDDFLSSLLDDGIPVVLVSGTTEPELYEGRASELLAKPFAPDDLVAAARRHLDNVSTR